MATDRTNNAQVHAQITLPTPANDDAFTQATRPVRLLTLEAGALRVMRHNEDLNPVYLRLAEPKPLVAELLCGVIARLLGLPAPEAFVVIIEPGQLAGSKLAHQTMRQLCVGTRDIGGTTFTQLLREDSETAQAMIKAWEHLIPVTALDEWLANPDRNLDNILYVAQTLHIIDHAEAFGGTCRDLFPLADITHDEFTNKLQGYWTVATPPKDKTY